MNTGNTCKVDFFFCLALLYLSCVFRKIFRAKVNIEHLVTLRSCHTELFACNLLKALDVNLFVNLYLNCLVAGNNIIVTVLKNGYLVLCLVNLNIAVDNNKCQSKC